MALGLLRSVLRQWLRGEKYRSTRVSEAQLPDGLGRDRPPTSGMAGIDLDDLVRIVRTPTGLELQDGARDHAIDALGRLADPRATAVLIEQVRTRGDTTVGAALALGMTSDASAVPALVDVLSDPHRFWVDRGAAAVALGELGGVASGALPALTAALGYSVPQGDESWDERAREAVEDAIRRIRKPGTKSQLHGKGWRYEMWGIR